MRLFCLFFSLWVFDQNVVVGGGVQCRRREKQDKGLIYNVIHLSQSITHVSYSYKKHIFERVSLFAVLLLLLLLSFTCSRGGRERERDWWYREGGICWLDNIRVASFSLYSSQTLSLVLFVFCFFFLIPIRSALQLTKETNNN